MKEPRSENEIEIRIRDTIRAIAAFTGRAPRRVALFAEDFNLLAGRKCKRVYRWGVRVVRGPSREAYFKVGVTR